MEPTALAALTLTAAMSLAQNSEWVSGEDLPRVARMAATIASVVSDEGCVIPAEDHCEENTAYALLGIAKHESDFASDVEDCSRCRLGGPYCDHGKAISIYQMHSNNWGGHSRAEVCQDLRLATSLARSALAKARGTWKNRFRVYAGRADSGLELLQAQQSILFFQKKATSHGLQKKWYEDALWDEDGPQAE